MIQLDTSSVVAVVGVGLIGGSFAAALRASGRKVRILGVGRDAHSLAIAKNLGLIDEAVSLNEAARQADIILLATPVGAMASLLSQLAPMLQANTLVTDAGSTKAELARQAINILGAKAQQFVPGHPIAGAEKAGPEAADASLYQDRTVVLTPLPNTPETTMQRIISLWELCGARVLVMPADLHDKVLASVSHVPHFLASVYMWQVATADDSDKRLALAGSGFRDFTRIAAGSAEVWRDIFLANRKAVLAELKEIRHALEQAEKALEASDGASLKEFLERAALVRRFWGSRSRQS